MANDVVAELDRWRTTARTAKNASKFVPMDGLLQRARDEIVALREMREAHVRMLSANRDETRAVAPSEEAAREAARVWYANITQEATVHGKLAELALALDAFTVRAVEAEREAWLGLVAEHLNGRFLNVRAFIAAAARRGER